VLEEHLHGTVPVVLDRLDLDLPATHNRVCWSRCARVPSSFASRGRSMECPSWGKLGHRHGRVKDTRSTLPSRCKAGRSLCLKQEPDSNRRTVSSSSSGGRDDDILRYKSRLW
jgi:hypothetical protein